MIKNPFNSLHRWPLTLLFIMGALISPSYSSAALIEVNLSFNLENSVIGSTVDYPMGWSVPYIYFPEVHPIAGDSLLISIDFADSRSNAQRLKISDVGIGEIIEGAFATVQGDISVNFSGTNFFTFHDAVGQLLSNPVSNSSLGGGAGVGTTLITNMTDSTFLFTGITYRIDFTQLTYHSGNGFNVMALGLGADRIDIIPAVPEPSSAILLVSGLALMAGIAKCRGKGPTIGYGWPSRIHALHTVSNP
jgi:hypothetical protein